MTVESRSVVVRLSAETAQYIREMQSAGKVGADAMSKVEKSSMSASQAQDKLAGGAGKVGLAAAVGLGAVVTAAADFDQSMSRVQAATHETTQNMDSLREAALQAGADTAFSATEAAEGIEALAKAGVGTSEILGGGLTGALDLAAAGELGVADAAEAAAGAMAQFKLEGDQVAHIADLLAAGAGKAQGEVSDMVLALKQAGTVSAQTGLSLEETVGALAAMAEQSLLGSDAGTSFKTMLAALTPNSVKAAQAMEQYNIHAFDAQGNFVGMTELAGQLRAGLGSLTDEQRAMALETIFGSDAVRAASIIYDNGAEGIANWTSKVNDAGFAAETASIKQDNLRGDLEKLGGALNTALIGTGDGAQGPLRSLTQSLEDAVNGYNNLGKGAKSGVAIALAATAALGGGIFVFSKIVQSAAATQTALTTLGVTSATTSRLMSGLGKAGFMLAGLAAGALAAEQLRKAVEESLPGTAELTGQILAISDGKVEGLGKEFDSLSASISRMDPGYIQRSSDAITGLLSLGILDGKEIDGAKQEIEALDDALASLASTGGTEVATKGFEDLAAAQGLSAAEQKDLLKLLPSYREALAANANQTSLTATETTELASSMQQAAVQTAAQKKALQEAKNQARDAAEEWINLGDSLDDAKVSLGDWLKELEEQQEALRNFEQNAKQAADNGLRKGLIAALEDAGPAGALRMKQLANATQEEIARANRAWAGGQEQIRQYIREATRVPKNLATRVEANTADAIADLITFRNALDEATKDRIFSVTTVYKVVRSASDALPDRTPTGATGGSGGQILGPGTTTSDSVPALLSNKEYVIQASAVEKYGVGFFDAANAMRLAGGGSASGSKPRKPEAGVVEATESEAERRRREIREQKAAEAAERYYSEQERAQREADQRAEDAAQRQKDYDDAVLAGQTRAWDMATDAAKAQVDASKAMVDAVKANMDRLGQAAVSAFDSPIFSKNSQQHGMWTGDTATSGWRGTLQGDISGLRERSSIITQLSDPSLGLSGKALETLLGQNDNASIAAMLANGEVADYAALFAEREKLLGEVSTQAGMAGYGTEWTAANEQWTKMNQKLDLLNALIASARPINVTETVSAAALAAEVARLQAISGGF